MTKKVNKQKCFSVITRNLNWEIFRRVYKKQDTGGNRLKRGRLEQYANLGGVVVKKRVKMFLRGS